MAGRLLFDVTGLLQWYAYFQHPSGVQRVTERLLASKPLCRRPRLEFVARALGSDLFFQVDGATLRALAHPDRRAAAVARLRAIFAQSMRLAPLQGLRAEAKYFHLPYIFLGQVGLGSLAEAWFTRQRPRAMPPLHLMPPPDPKDTLFNPGDFWCHDGYVDALVGLKHRTGVRLVQFIHDLFVVEHPEWSHPRFGRLLVDGLVRLAPQVDGWLTNSQFVRDSVAGYLAARALPDASIAVLPMGWDVRDPTDRPDHHADHVVLERHGIADKAFILHVGTVEPRKNLVALLDVLAALRLELGSRVPHCVLVGRDGWKSDSVRQRLKQTADEGGTLHWFRHVSENDLAAFYRSALFSVVPSHAEGWGLPVQESLVHGVPCIASGAGALRESGRDLAVYADPANPAEFKAALRAWITDTAALAAAREQLRHRLGERHLPTWDEAGEVLLKATAPLP